MVHFPEELKTADIMPAYEKKKKKERTRKKKNVNDKANYRSISFFPIVPKLTESLFIQLENVDKILSPTLSDFRKGHPSQDALLTLFNRYC